MKKVKAIFMFTITSLIIGCSQPAGESAEAAPSPEPETTQTQAQETPEDNVDVGAIIEAHLAAFGENDLDALMKDYTEESVLFAPDSTYRGLEAIKGLFISLFPAFPAGQVEVNIDRFEVDANVVYVVWHGSAPTLEVPIGTDTFVFEGDKIRTQTFAAKIDPKPEAEAAGS